MTRFARAKGSKASNERVPEEATSWGEMKQQLLEKNKEIEESIKRKDALEKRNANYKAFLEEKESDRSKNASWAEFPGSSNTITKENKKESKLSTAEITPKQNIEKEPEHRGSDSDEPPEEESSKKEISNPIIAKKKKTKPKKLLKITLEQENKSNERNGNHEESAPTRRKNSESAEGVKKKKLKREADNNADSVTNKQNPDAKKQKKIVKENLTEKDLKKIEKKKQKRIKQVEKKKQIKALKKKEEEMKAEGNSETKGNEGEIEKQNSEKSFEKPLNKNTSIKKSFNNVDKAAMRKKILGDKEEHARKKPFLPHKMFINGKELEIEYVDGFPVKKEDAVRIKKLRREMISKGLPRSEINVALKLERRKAEKAFAREKKKVSSNLITKIQ